MYPNLKQTASANMSRVGFLKENKQLRLLRPHPDKSGSVSGRVMDDD